MSGISWTICIILICLLTYVIYINLKKKSPLTWIPSTDIPGAQYAFLYKDPKTKNFIMLESTPPHSQSPPHSFGSEIHGKIVSGEMNLGSANTFTKEGTLNQLDGTDFRLPSNKVHYAWTGDKPALALTYGSDYDQLWSSK